MTTNAPIILIGTQRSGTTWLGSLFRGHQDIAYWEEPRHVWTWSHGYRRDDRLVSKDATPRITRHIHKTFSHFVTEAGKQRLVEKTPSNCLRIPFIHAVYPEARILLVVRDGRSVFRSTSEILQKGVSTNRIIQRAKQTPIWEWPAYAQQAASTITRKITRKPLRYWGPRPPDWKSWLNEQNKHIILAKQWSATITCAMDDAEKLGPSAVHIFHYEDLMENPKQVFEKIIDFIDLDHADDLIETVDKTADPQRMNKWRNEIDPAILECVRPIMEPTLNRLGYQW